MAEEKCAVLTDEAFREPAGVSRQVFDKSWEDPEMPVRKECTAEFKEQAVRFVFEEIGPDESRSAAVERLAPKLSVRPATLMNWVKAAAPPAARRTAAAGSVEE